MYICMYVYATHMYARLYILIYICISKVVSSRWILIYTGRRPRRLSRIVDSERAKYASRVPDIFANFRRVDALLTLSLCRTKLIPLRLFTALLTVLRFILVVSRL